MGADEVFSSLRALCNLLMQVLGNLDFFFCRVHVN